MQRRWWLFVCIISFSNLIYVNGGDDTCTSFQDDLSAALEKIKELESSLEVIQSEFATEKTALKDAKGGLIGCTRSLKEAEKRTMEMLETVSTASDGRVREEREKCKRELDEKDAACNEKVKISEDNIKHASKNTAAEAAYSKLLQEKNAMKEKMSNMKSEEDFERWKKEQERELRKAYAKPNEDLKEEVEKLNEKITLMKQMHATELAKARDRSRTVPTSSNYEPSLSGLLLARIQELHTSLCDGSSTFRRELADDMSRLFERLVSALPPQVVSIKESLDPIMVQIQPITTDAFNSFLILHEEVHLRYMEYHSMILHHYREFRTRAIFTIEQSPTLGQNAANLFDLAVYGAAILLLLLLLGSIIRIILWCVKTVLFYSCCCCCCCGKRKAKKPVSKKKGGSL